MVKADAFVLNIHHTPKHLSAPGPHFIPSFILCRYKQDLLSGLFLQLANSLLRTQSTSSDFAAIDFINYSNELRGLKDDKEELAQQLEEVRKLRWKQADETAMQSLAYLTTTVNHRNQRLKDTTTHLTAQNIAPEAKAKEMNEALHVINEMTKQLVPFMKFAECENRPRLQSEDVLRRTVRDMGRETWTRSTQTAHESVRVNCRVCTIPFASSEPESDEQHCPRFVRHVKIYGFCWRKTCKEEGFVGKGREEDSNEQANGSELEEESSDGENNLRSESALSGIAGSKEEEHWA